MEKKAGYVETDTGGAAWLLNRPEHTKDPREDEEQMEYLREWSEKHGKANRKE